MASNHLTSIIALQRREAERLLAVVAQDKLHGPVAEAAQPIVEKNGAVGHGCPKASRSRAALTIDRENDHPSPDWARPSSSESSTSSESVNRFRSGDHVATREEIHMCGIVATVSRRGDVSEDALHRATRRLHHRGPDAQRTWVDPRRRAGLGHARLSIIDLTTGDQPIANEDNRLHLVHNGEFYDFERMRTRLERDGHAFRTRSDSEIELHLYEAQGARSVHELRGEFAYAIWDERDGALFAARDRFGIKPLYYTVHDGTFYLASEVKAFIELGVPLRWDR